MARAGSIGPGHTVGSGMFRRSRDNMNKGERDLGHCVKLLPQSNVFFRQRGKSIKIKFEYVTS